MNQLDDLLDLQRRIEKLRKKETKYEFWVCTEGRDVYAAKLVGSQVFLFGPLSYDDVEDTDHLSEFPFRQDPLTRRERSVFERSATLNDSHSAMCKEGKPKHGRKQHHSGKVRQVQSTVRHLRQGV